MTQYSLSEVYSVLGLPPEERTFKPVNGVTADSSRVRPGWVFCAFKGSSADGHTFIPEAIRNGAVAVVCDRNWQPPASKGSGLSVPLIKVAQPRQALSNIAAWLAGNPSQNLMVCGITGTNGKTTTNWMIFNALAFLGMKCLRIGTLGISSSEGWSEAGELTTPDPERLQACLRQAVDSGHQACVMEVSSHSLDQRRADSVHFDCAVFTNLTRDHLDYHAGMEQYFAAKLRLFNILASSDKRRKLMLIGIDDEYGRRILEQDFGAEIECVTFGEDPSATVRIVSYRQSPLGSLVTLGFEGRNFEMESNYIGVHNAQNLAAAFGVCTGLGFDGQHVCEALEALPQVPGRLEAVHRGDFGVYVDYAHTPDALDRALRALRPVCRGKLFVLFGCGGDRDRGKRPIMGEVAAQLADSMIVTSDNPRTEDPEQIIKGIIKGLSREAIQSQTTIEPDRRKAISSAIQMLDQGDVLLIAGKGHEDYQIIGKEKLHFSDQEEVRKVLAGR